MGQYYKVLQQQPDLIHQFYTETSRAIRVDGDATETADTLLVKILMNPVYKIQSFYFQYRVKKNNLFVEEFTRILLIIEV